MLLSADRLRPAYQPIVDLDTGTTVGYEALARWPGLGVTPEQAFAAAARVGRTVDMDRCSQVEALRGAINAKLDRSLTLFINGEPSSFATAPNAAFLEMADRTADRFRVVMEITERRLMHRPGELLRAVRSIRERGWGIALDDVGAVPDSLAILPLVAPDVIKLDLGLVQKWPTSTQARIVTAVMAYVERTGATVLAEGIETAAHLEQALALGATLGQGWYCARASALPQTLSVDQPIAFLKAAADPPATPFELVEHGPLRVGPKGLLLGIARHLENQGMALEVPPIVLSVFQEARNFTPATSVRYAELARRCPLVAAVGHGLEADPAVGVVGAPLKSTDPLRGEWVVVVLGTHYSGALIARDLGDPGPDLERRFAFTVTHRPVDVIAAALSILERVRSPERFHPHRASLLGRRLTPAEAP